MRLTSAELIKHSHNINVSPCALTSRAFGIITIEGWSSDFPPLPSAFSSKRAMAYCLGTIMEFTAAGQSEIYTRVPN